MTGKTRYRPHPLPDRFSVAFQEQQAGTGLYFDENDPGAFFMEVKSTAYGDLDVRALPNVLVAVSS